MPLKRANARGSSRGSHHASSATVHTRTIIDMVALLRTGRRRECASSQISRSDRACVSSARARAAISEEAESMPTFELTPPLLVETPSLLAVELPRLVEWRLLRESRPVRLASRMALPRAITSSFTSSADAQCTARRQTTTTRSGRRAAAARRCMAGCGGLVAGFFLS